MSRYGMAAPKAKDAKGSTPEYLSAIYDVIEAPKEKRDEYGAMPWESLLRLSGTDFVTRKTVTGADRVTAGRVWFRQGGVKDGSLAGRTLFYQQG